MRRIIEELIQKRTNQQHKVKETLQQLGRLIESTGLLFNKKKKGAVTQKLLEFSEDLNQLMTIQDKEWDAYSNNHSTGVFKSLEWKIQKLEAEYSNVKTLLANFITLEKSMGKLIDSIEEKTDPDALNRLKEFKEQLSTYQYSDFEQRFRGGESDVKEKLKKYLPHFPGNGPVLDIGCGRGEFVELLQQEGKEAEGIDISLSMLRAAEEKGLNCSKADALGHLRQKEDQSLAGIFSAQVIEHLQPEYLRELVLDAHRVLKPGSPILLETVNPLSLFALSNIYFLDVTHQKPLHPEYMRFLLESSGFGSVEIIYADPLSRELLQEIGPEHPVANAFNSNVDKLNKLLYAAPAYAVKGIKE